MVTRSAFHGLIESIELQTKLVSSQFNVKSAVEGNFDQPDSFSFGKYLVCSS